LKILLEKGVVDDFSEVGVFSALYYSEEDEPKEFRFSQCETPEDIPNKEKLSESKQFFCLEEDLI
jgi:hypothetical protein